MARVTKSHKDRKNEIIDTAQNLFYQKGYNNISVATIINTIGIAKGTFYHYFKSKSDLLDQIVNRQVRMIDQVIDKVLEEPEKDAVEELNNIYKEISQYKAENKEVMLMITKVLYSDDNLELRTKLMEKRIKIVAPKIAKVITRGISEGVFTTPDNSDPQHVAVLLLSMGSYLGEEFARMTLNEQLDQENKMIFFQQCRLYEKAVERILGLKAGDIKIFSEKSIGVFFD